MIPPEYGRASAASAPSTEKSLWRRRRALRVPCRVDKGPQIVAALDLPYPRGPVARIRQSCVVPQCLGPISRRRDPHFSAPRRVTPFGNPSYAYETGTGGDGEACTAAICPAPSQLSAH